MTITDINDALDKAERWWTRGVGVGMDESVTKVLFDAVKAALELRKLVNGALQAASCDE